MVMPQPARSIARRISIRVLLALASSLPLFAATAAHAQAGAVYRCGVNDYTNTLTEDQAASRHCVKVSRTDWVFSATDAVGRQYTYNERRTVVRDDGTVETWLQVVPSARAADVGTTSTDVLPYLRIVSPQVIRCRQRTITSGATYYVNVRDNSISKEPSGRSGFFPPPERVAEALARQLCADGRGTICRAGSSQQRSICTSITYAVVPERSP